MFNLTKEELAELKKLSTPIKIQDFLDTFPRNLEKKGETYMSPRRVLRERKMHCMEGALLAALALWLQGEEPLLLDLKAPKDDDHIIALYKRNGYWGAISKSNHIPLRFRDPIYKTVRELVLSYFHEYINYETGEKTLRKYSRPLNLKRLGMTWITAEEDLFDIAIALDELPHTPIIPPENIRLIRRPDKMEERAGEILEWKSSNPRT